MELSTWLQDNHIVCDTHQYPLITINQQNYLVVQHKEQGGKQYLLDEHFQLILTDEEQDLLGYCQYYVFEFGGQWYYSDCTEEKIVLNPLKYIGKADISLSEQYPNFPYLGIHGKYELCSGSRDYKDWIAKAKFLNISTLGICEFNTLAGTLVFQQACLAAKIKPILGETISVKSKEGEIYEVKVFVRDQEQEKGWINLLNINAEINVHNEQQFITQQRLFELSKGLVCVIHPDVILSKKLIELYKTHFSHLYFQFDYTQWASDERDKQVLLNIKDYLDNYYEILPPCLISDSYYLDKQDASIKKTLAKIGKAGFYNQSFDQHFKNLDELFESLDQLSGQQEDTQIRLFEIFDQAANNAAVLGEICNATIPLGELHLPEYKMTEQEKEEYASNEDLFNQLIAQGFDLKVAGKVEDENVYWDRIEQEVAVIKKGGFVDYFLITWDILNWCKTNDILTGAGRGSSAGSLIAYLLNIVKIDPLKYGLLFERFLNEGRLGKSLPDVDNDVEGSRRDDVKRYMESRYGIDNVTSIGTFGTFKIKAALQDLARQKGISPKTMAYVNSLVDAEWSFTQLFEQSTTIPTLKQFILANPDVVNQIPLLFEQPRTQSMHAAGVVITPDNYKGEKMTAYDWMPIKKVDGVLVSEWEGPQIESAGFLKEDILGIRQLEKFKQIFKMIEENSGEKLAFDNIPLDNQEVFALFQQGLNEDVFQFGAVGLKGYCQVLRPDCFEDLIATVALYRPGPMEIGAHSDYAKTKHGEKQLDFDFGTEEITKNTYSVMVYQEQIMQICQSLGGFTLAQADDVRKAMGKKDLEKMMESKDRFIKGAKNNGCPEHEAVKIWNKMEGFAGYAFNKSHATVYAYTGYVSQWLKHMYPLEFWTTSLQYAKDEQLPSRISEIHRTSAIKIAPPDINKSDVVFRAYKDTNSIYWSISSIKQVGEKTVEAILLERKEGGHFFSLEEFYHRVPKKSMKKNCIINLILAGAFDEICDVKKPNDRLSVMRQFFKMIEEPLPEQFQKSDLYKDFYWTLWQKEASGLGYFDFEAMYKSHAFSKDRKYKYIGMEEFFLDKTTNLKQNSCAIMGVIQKITERRYVSKKTGLPEQFAVVELSCNHETIMCTMFHERWSDDIKSLINKQEGKLLIITGSILGPNQYNSRNHFQTTKETKLDIL